jgi:hypothetical protein
LEIERLIDFFAKINNAPYHFGPENICFPYHGLGHGFLLILSDRLYAPFMAGFAFSTPTVEISKNSNT